MKWFFLLLLVLLAVGGERLIIGSTPLQLSADRVATAAAFATICLALFAHWRASYLLEGAAQDRGSENAHLISILSVAVYCMMLGGDMALSEGCAYRLPEGGSSQKAIRALGEVTGYLQERGWCAGLGYFLLLVGGAISWPTLRLLFGGSKRDRRPPL